MGTNWFMPAFVNRRFGESGMSELDGTMVCSFDLKKSRNDWRISVLVIIRAPRRLLLGEVGKINGHRRVGQKKYRRFSREAAKQERKA
jgi:hypothetical protein